MLMKAKKFLIIALACVLTCLSFLLGGCTDPWDIKKEADGYYYALCSENGELTKSEKKADWAIILGRVNNDEIIDELVIPKELGGFPVKQIGEYYKPIEGQDRLYSIDCKNIGKIVINHSCYLNKYCFDNFGGELEINADVRTSSVSQFVPRGDNTTSKLIKFNIDFQYLTDFKTWSRLWKYDWTDDVERQKVEVGFYADGGEQTTYAYVVAKNTVIESPIPPTKEGYTFAGWFDEDYETQWNFETDKVTGNITLCAKWIAD